MYIWYSTTVTFVYLTEKSGNTRDTQIKNYCISTFIVHKQIMYTIMYSFILYMYNASYNIT